MSRCLVAIGSTFHPKPANLHRPRSDAHSGVEVRYEVDTRV